jgi:hypothetical protein
MKTESTQELELRRNLMINASENSNDLVDKIVYNTAIKGLDRELNRRIWKRNVAIGLIVSVIVFIAIAVLGCAKMLGGAGQIIDGFGDGLSYAGQHLQESVKENK